MTSQPELRSLGQTLGTEVLGIDLATIDDQGFAQVRGAFAEHPVLVSDLSASGALLECQSNTALPVGAAPTSAGRALRVALQRSHRTRRA